MYLVSLDAFNCHLKTSISGSSVKTVTFDVMDVTRSSSFANNDLTISDKNAVFWTFISVDVPAHSQVQVNLKGAQNTFALYKNHTTLADYDTMCRQGILNASINTKITMENNNVGASTRSYQFYWGGFRIDTLFDPFNAFHVVRSSSNIRSATWCNSVTRLCNITYDIISFEAGPGWNRQKSVYFVPADGTYFFTFGCGVGPSAQNSMYINIDGIEISSTQPGLESILNPSDVDFFSKSLLINLKRNTAVNIVATDFINLKGDSYNSMIYFAGFQYSLRNWKNVSVLYTSILHNMFVVVCCS